jgi:PAS domain S-box-containing protein
MTPERAQTDADGGSERAAMDPERALEELRVSEERFRTLLSNIPGAMYRCGLDSDWDMEFISDNIESISGYPASEFIQSSVRTFASIIHPDDRDGVEQTVGDAVTRGEPYILEYRIVGRSTTR